MKRAIIMVHNNPSTRMLRHGFLSLSAAWCLHRDPVPKSEEEKGRGGRKGETEEKDAKKIDHCQVKSNTFRGFQVNLSKTKEQCQRVQARPRRASMSIHPLRTEIDADEARAQSHWQQSKFKTSLIRMKPYVKKKREWRKKKDKKGRRRKGGDGDGGERESCFWLHILPQHVYES